MRRAYTEWAQLQSLAPVSHMENQRERAVSVLAVQRKLEGSTDSSTESRQLAVA